MEQIQTFWRPVIYFDQSVDLWTVTHFLARIQIQTPTYKHVLSTLDRLYSEENRSRYLFLSEVSLANRALRDPISVIVRSTASSPVACYSLPPPPPFITPTRLDSTFVKVTQTFYIRWQSILYCKIQTHTSSMTHPCGIFRLS